MSIIYSTRVGHIERVCMTAVNEFLKELRAALHAENYEKISNLLEIEMLTPEPVTIGKATGKSKRKQSVTFKMKLVHELGLIEGDSHNVQLENEIWSSLVSSHFKVLKLINGSEYLEAATEQINVLNAFLRIFSASSHLPLLYRINGDCWNLALLSGSAEAQEQAARAINRSFIACITERAVLTPQSRKWGTYKTAALLLRVYFHLRQLNLVQNVLRALQACELPEIDEFPRAHTITFNYFLGRYHFGREEYEAAESCFTYCYMRLPSQSTQLTSVLHYLIPIKMILNLARPTSQLISLFGKDQDRNFHFNLVEIIRSGDVQAFKVFLSQNCRVLIKMDSFGLYEKLLLLVLRQKIIRIHRLCENSTRISLNLLHNLLLPDFTLDDVACLVANTISRGLIRGYISEEKLFLVLSAQNPFPSGFTAALCDK